MLGTLHSSDSTFNQFIFPSSSAAGALLNAEEPSRSVNASDTSTTAQTTATVLTPPAASKDVPMIGPTTRAPANKACSRPNNAPCSSAATSPVVCVVSDVARM